MFSIVRSNVLSNRSISPRVLGFNASLLPTGLSATPSFSPHFQQIREIRKGKAKKKPKYTYKVDLNGHLVYPKSLTGYDPDQLETFNKWLKRTAESTKKHLGTGMGDRFMNAMNNAIKDYFNTNFGTRNTEVKERAKIKRIIKRKARYNRNLAKGIENWNKLEDKKEDKIFRDLRRIQREENREPFSFKLFLREQREKKRKPVVIEDEETFLKKLQEDQKKYLFNTPKTVRRRFKFGTRLGFWKQIERDVVDPFLHEIRRKGRIAQLVQRREDDIARLKWQQVLQKQKETILKERQEKSEKLREHWNRVLGQWHKQNNFYLVMKRENQLYRYQLQKLAREEFLAILNTTVGNWVKHPNECRFQRFRMVETGKQFPYNNTQYGS